MSNQLLPVHWCNLSNHSDDLLQDNFTELNAQLRFKYPDLPAIQFELLPADLLRQLPDYLIAMLPGRNEKSSYPLYQSKRIFVFCEGNEHFVSDYQQQNALALWGVAIPTTVALAWIPDKFLIWHEILHLLNAKDCYNKYGINKCQLGSCIMQYAPPLESCEGELTLCSKNVKRIRRFAAQIRDMD